MGSGRLVPDIKSQIFMRLWWRRLWCSHDDGVDNDHDNGGDDRRDGHGGGGRDGGGTLRPPRISRVVGYGGTK